MAPDEPTHDEVIHDQLMKYAGDVSRLYQELKTENRRLERAYNELVTVQYQTVLMGFDLIALHNDFLGGHCKRVARYAGDLAAALGLDARTMANVKLAALMHDIGLIGIPSRRVVRLMQGEEKAHEFVTLYRQHPDIQIRPLTTSERFSEIADFIRAHHELMDGSGFPKGIKGDRIPLGSRIIAVADRCDLLKQHAPVTTLPRQILETLEREAHRRYDFDIFCRFMEMMLQGDPFYRIEAVDIKDLAGGMVLAEPVLSHSRVKLLAAETVLNRDQIQRIRRYARHLSLKLPIRVYATRASA